jgi:dTDP-4-dehydrorhamnose reductase
MTILLTGGSGRLGQALQTLLPGCAAPSRSELDITQSAQVTEALRRYQPDVIVHAAAYTDVKQAELERSLCWEVNVTGTRNLVRAAGDCTLIHISTDYVFWGDTGNYPENATPGPVRNYYALSKLVAEEIVRLHPRHLVIRTSFRPDTWPYPVAFDDLYTSQDYLDVIAPDIALAIQHVAEIPDDMLHIATERKSVYELAKRRASEVRSGSKEDAGVNLPDDVSLDTTRWQRLKQRWQEVTGGD